MIRRLAVWVPRWWRGEGGVTGAAVSRLLVPAEQAFRFGQWVRTSSYDRRWIKPFHAPIQVVSVGNLTVGGTGKTPVTAWIARKLREAGLRPGVVLRGYGADEIEVHRELNPQIPVLADRRRIEAVLGAAAEGCDVAILDDAFQHRALHRDLDIVLIAAESWTASRRLLPRGPWRERVQALERADLVIVTRKVKSAAEAAEIGAELRGYTPARALVRIALLPADLRSLHDLAEPQPLRWLDGRKIVVVASLADPAAFDAQLRGAGAETELAEYPDHHRFTAADVQRLVERAGERPLVMTLKEAVKLRRLIPPTTSAYFVDQELIVEHGMELIELALAEMAPMSETGR